MLRHSRGHGRQSIANGRTATSSRCVFPCDSAVLQSIRWHPNRVAIVRGPVVFAQQVVHKHLVSIPPDDEALNEWMVATNNPMVFRYAGQEQSSQRDDFMPFYQFAEMQTYRMYFDPALRNVLW